MRRTNIAPGEHYHIFNRGNNKQLIFLDDHDRIRLMFLIFFFQAPIYFPNISRQVSIFQKNLSVEHPVFNKLSGEIKLIQQKRYVELEGFALMPNHFHMIVLESQEGGIAQYMQRVLNSYTKYFNAKYQKSGHLFQGPFKAVHIKSNEQLLYLSAYIHRNPRELAGWQNREDSFPWSSYQDCIRTNRWGPLLKTDLISSQFENSKEYEYFVKTSGAKELKETLDEELVID